MNICFFSGIIESEPNFKFIISKNNNFKDSLHISICMFDIKINDNTVVKAQAYDELADFCFQNFRRGDFVAISGRLNDINHVEVDFCQQM